MRQLRKPYIKDRRVEIAAGLALGLAAALLLNDAYAGRAQEQPLWLRPFAFW